MYIVELCLHIRLCAHLAKRAVHMRVVVRARKYNNVYTIITRLTAQSFISSLVCVVCVHVYHARTKVARI